MNARRALTGRMGPHLPGPWLVVAAILLAGCDDRAEQTSAAAAPPPAVAVVEVARQPVTPSVSFTGRVVAIDKVDLRARVTGFLEQRAFTEGQESKRAICCS